MKPINTFLLTASLSVLVSAISAQDKDPKAKAILDDLSKKMKAYTSFTVEFSSKLEKKSDGVNETQSGKATIKGNKYIVEVGDQKILCDGATTWTILTGDKEVYESKVGADQDDLLDPSKMFSLWEKDFKYKLAKEETVAGSVIAEIHLFPTKAGSKYHTVIIKIDKTKMEMKSVVVKGKDGEVLTYTLTKLTTNVASNDADFKFDKAKYPGYTVIKD